MAKSSGNLVFVGDLLKEHSAAAIRMLILDRRWGQAWDFTRPAWTWRGSGWNGCKRRPVGRNAAGRQLRHGFGRGAGGAGPGPRRSRRAADRGRSGGQAARVSGLPARTLVAPGPMTCLANAGGGISRLKCLTG